MKNAESIFQELKAGKFAPIYFFQGDEPFYIDKLTNYIEVNAIPESQQGFNQTILYGQDVAMSDVLNNARRFPMMAERQLVIVKEAQQIKDFGREGGQSLLQQYLDNPVPTTILVFSHKNKSLDGRKAITKAIQKSAVFLNSKRLYDNEVPKWVNEFIRGKGFTVTPEAAMMLADSIGNNLERLSNEIEKIMINFADPVQIDGDMVQKYVGISKDYNVFELQNAILKRDRVRAFKIVNYFAANSRQHPVIPMIAMLYSMFTKLLVVHAQGRRKEPINLTKFGVNNYFLNDYKQGAQNYSLNQVVANIHSLRMADLHCKGVDSASSEGEELKELVARIIG